MNPSLAFCQPNTGLPLVALGSLAAQESIAPRRGLELVVTMVLESHYRRNPSL